VIDINKACHEEIIFSWTGGCRSDSFRSCDGFGPYSNYDTGCLDAPELIAAGSQFSMKSSFSGTEHPMTRCAMRGFDLY
jgi:hypothetical protein